MKRFAAVFVLFLLMVSAPLFGQVFKDGDTVCFLGDSITHGGVFHYDIYDYYLTRFPERTIHFYNAGISGDSASGALGRLQEDVYDRNPTAIAIMFAMNDVGRGNYVANPTAAQLKAQKGAIDRFFASTQKIVEQTESKLHPQFFFITPSPFDQTAVMVKDNNQPGCNDGLGQCAELVRKYAAEKKATVVDFHGPMTALNLKMQKTDPKWTIIGPDRVHPREPGHLMMAWLFLKAQNAPSLVSNIEVDFAAPKILKSENAMIADLEADHGKLTFSVLEKALPFPIDAEANSVLQLLPITEDLNREIFSVKGLNAPAAKLLIDGNEIGSFSKAELEKGINLAMNPKTPQYQQAQKVHQIGKTRRGIERKLRTFAAIRWYCGHRRVNPDDLAAVQKFYDGLSEKAKNGWYEKQIPHYIKNWNDRQNDWDQIKKIEKELLETRLPVQHEWTILPVK
ncbi:MAG: SGNH/GDSL hydrolase family protein [Planctomycetia bacterium]|nr:SGNH/GDSL hydrolase family protein [Planctomycetia bacterium]